MAGSRARRWGLIVAAGLGIATVFGFGVSWMMFSLWSDLRQATPAEAEHALAGARRQAGDGPPYLEVAGDGTVSVRRDLEGDRSTRLTTLHVLAWEPGSGRLLRVDLPYWFVRAKMTESINLGTLTAALAGDWRHIDLRVAERDLERRGPGLILDHERRDGARLLIWTE